ncbi:MAG: inositol-phosphate phosphatase [Gammaproteobacteria bacterium]|nr:inositol-phosphate phosphatase [Gammaproteobacteria bacterium]MCP5460062.1 inositol-phosphate phosphatase [Gammaproteobacteria bacterium]
MPYSLQLQTAIEAARAAEDVIKHYYRGDLGVRFKEDQSPVTVADVESEKTIKAILQQAFPHYGFYGEETGRDHTEADHIWLVDPIDGTKSFIRGYPFFSTQIALLLGGELILGVSNAPLFNELAYAEKGGGAFLNGESIRVSQIQSLADATLSLGNLKTVAGDTRWPRLGDLICACNRTRGYGDFYHYHLLAAGKLEIVMESDINILDVAALSVIIREAGGHVTDMEGRPLGFDTTSILASNACLHDIVLQAIKTAGD